MDIFENAVLKRRSVYGIGKELPIKEGELRELLGGVLLHTPTAYHMKSTRLVLLTGKEHARLWEIVLESIRKKAVKGISERTVHKIGTFAAGYGSVLFFDDTSVTQTFKAENPAYAPQFEPWALQQNGMLQYAVWTVLAEKGIGASLQHYNPLIDDEVKKAWGLPASWQLLAQMPFGNITSPAGEKDRGTKEGRFLFFGGA